MYYGGTAHPPATERAGPDKPPPTDARASALPDKRYRAPDEAVIYVLQNRENWTATRGALQWLAETVQTLPPPDEKRP